MFTAAQLSNPNINHDEVAGMYRDLFLHRRKDFLRLKFHEKHYAFDWMRVTYTGTKAAFNLYRINEAREYIFYDIVLTYGEDVDNFTPPLSRAFKKLTPYEIRRDKRFFHEYLPIWKNEIVLHKGPYLGVLYPMLYRKLKELKEICSDKEYIAREKYCFAVFFYLYYRVRLYFDEIIDRCITFDIHGFTFVVNVYSFCHIFSRHYVPSLNRGLTNTMNTQNDGIDIKDLPNSLRGLISTYFSYVSKLSESHEYLLFKFNGIPHILWIKYKRIPELHNNKGFEVRSYYRCESPTDLDKFIGKTEIKHSSDCYIFI